MKLIVNMPSVTLLIEDILARANAHEHQEYQRYRWLSLRFLTYHIGTSKLMQTLASESQQRMHSLIEVSASLPIEPPRLGEPAIGPCPDLHGQRHFFIYDNEMAAQELSRALLEEWRSRRFYERLQDCNAIPDLDAWLNVCINQSLSQFLILQEARDRLPTLAFPASAISNEQPSAQTHEREGMTMGWGRERQERSRHSGQARYR